MLTGSVPSGLIVPALGAGAIFGRLVGQIVPDTSAAIFAMVGAAAFLAGVSRMTVSLTVIMLELTGEVEYIPPFMMYEYIPLATTRFFTHVADQLLVPSSLQKLLLTRSTRKASTTTPC